MLVSGIDSTSAAAHSNFGSALRLKGRLDEAVSHLEESLRLELASAAAHYSLGLALYEKGRLDEAMPDIKRKIAGAENVIMESNSILRFIQPDIYLSVLDAGTEDFKASAAEFLGRADAIILHRREYTPKWYSVPLEPLADRPIFLIEPPDYVTPEIANFVREKMAGCVAPPGLHNS